MDVKHHVYLLTFASVYQPNALTTRPNQLRHAWAVYGYKQPTHEAKLALQPTVTALRQSYSLSSATECH